MPLDSDVARLAKGKHLAAVVTLMPDGQPQALFTWIDCDDEHVLVNTEPVRQRAKNVRRDPRVTVLIGGDSPWDWAEVRGHVVEIVGGQRARDHIDELSRRYSGTDYQNPIGPEGRIILRIKPDKVNTSTSRMARRQRR
jgi:PPOX class probable F420-dependent enzyme